jgi:DNA-binding IclR family transcriptional regulator
LERGRSVVSKVVAIVRSFDSGGALTVTEIAQVADLPLSTAHRLTHELAAWGLLHRRDDARFEAVLRVHAGSHRDWPLDLRESAAPAVEDLSAIARNDVRLGVLDGLRVSYVEKPTGSRPLSAFSEAATLPVHATALGKALLAFSPADVVDNVIRHGLQRYTSSTMTTAVRLRHALCVTRLRGMAVVSGELRPDHSAVAVPVFGPDGEAVAALEVRLRDVRAELPCVVPALTVAARALSRDLGRAVLLSGPAHPALQEPLSTPPVGPRDAHGTIRRSARGSVAGGEPRLAGSAHTSSDRIVLRRPPAHRAGP